jgi:hypothetical protein
MDLSGYANSGGKVHISLYVDNPKAIIGGQLEFSPSNASDIDEYTFGAFGGTIKINPGWNDIILPLTQAAKLGSADWSRINYIRFYLNPVGNVTARFADFYLFK